MRDCSRDEEQSRRPEFRHTKNNQWRMRVPLQLPNYQQQTVPANHQPEDNPQDG